MHHAANSERHQAVFPGAACDTRAMQAGYIDRERIETDTHTHTHTHTAVDHDGQVENFSPSSIALRWLLKSDEVLYRYTFLVNIWIGHEPLGLEPLEEEQLEQLSSLNLTLDLESAAECKRATVSAAPRSPLRPPFISNFGPTGIEHEVSFGHISELEDASARFCTLEVDLGAEDSQGRIRPSPMQRQSSDVAINAGSRQQQQQGKRKRSSDGDKAGDISLAYADFNDEDDDDSHDDGDGDDDAITLGR